MRGTVSCTSAGAGRTELPWGCRERQADGSPAEGHPHFFQDSKASLFRCSCKVAGGRTSCAPRLRREALSPDGLLLVPRNDRRPLPQTAGEGCLRLLLLSWKKILMAPCRASIR